MNIFTDLLFLFLFLYSVLFFKIPDIENDNYINHKFILFLAIFVFSFTTQIIAKLRNNCAINHISLISKSLQIAVMAVIGYSLYVDLNIMEWSKDYVSSVINSKYSLYLTVSIIMIMFIAVIKIVQLIFDSETGSTC